MMLIKKFWLETFLCKKCGFALVLILVCLPACQVKTSNKHIPKLYENAAIPSNPSPSITPISPPFPTAKSTSIDRTALSTLQNITTTNIYNVWWSLDSSTLFYGAPNVNMAYEIGTGKTNLLVSKALLEQTPSPKITTQLPSDTVRSFVSPSMSRALSFHFTQPPLSQDSLDGEVSTRGGIVEIHYYQIDGFERVLGEIEFCGFDEAQWTSDENLVVIPRSPDISLCGSTYAWLIDLKSFTVFPLFPNENYLNPVRTYSISSDGKALIYGILGSTKLGETENPLYLLNLQDMNSVQLNTPQVAHMEGWLSPREILLSFKSPSSSTSDFALGIYDVSDHRLTLLSPMPENTCLRFVTVSPDHRWVAFATTNSTCDIMKDLWLMPLER